jgi:hypothetical protein
LSPQAKDVQLRIGPLRVSQIFDITFKDGEEKKTPIGNLITSAGFKIVLLADIELYITNSSAKVIQVLAVVVIDDSVDLGALNGSLCYLENPHVIQTNVNDGIYLMGKYSLFKTSKDKLGDRDVKTVKPKNKVLIGWESAGTDDYVKQLNAVVEKLTKGGKRPEVKVILYVSSSVTSFLTPSFLEVRGSHSQRSRFFHQLS